MGFPKNLKDLTYELLTEPTLDHFREFMRNQTGEHNSIDFKEIWIEKSKLAKEILAIANSGGGILVFGVKENTDNSFDFTGLTDLVDEAQLSNDLKAFISSNLEYTLHSFTYEDSEYKKLLGKKFQILVIEDKPEFLPYISLKDGAYIKGTTIYVRRGTSCEAVNEPELQKILSRRDNYVYPTSGKPLTLKEHLTQLSELYNHISATEVSQSEGVISNFAKSLYVALGGDILFGEVKEVPNPLYPEEDYEDFIVRMIAEKKKKIERVLDLR